MNYRLGKWPADDGPDTIALKDQALRTSFASREDHTIKWFVIGTDRFLQKTSSCRYIRESGDLVVNILMSDMRIRNGWQAFNV